WRLLYLTFHGKKHADEKVIAHIHEAPISMWGPLVLLALGAICSGYLLKPLFQQISAPAMVLYTHEGFLVTWLPLIGALSGIGVATVLYLGWPTLPNSLSQAFPNLYQLFLNKWYVDKLYERLFVRPFEKLGFISWRVVDQQVIDEGLPHGASRL